MRLPSAALAVVALVGSGLGPAPSRAEVLLPGTQPSDGSGDPAFPPFRDLDEPGRLAAPGACARCHAGYRIPGDAIHEPFDSWAGSMMANASRDPLFWAALDVANQDDALLGDAGVGDLCLRCHVPRGWYEGRSRCDTPWGEDFDGACLEGSMTGGDDDFEGVSCHLCHRVYDASSPPPDDPPDPEAPRVGNAQLYLTTDPLLLIGPYEEAQTDRHGFLGSELQRSGDFCGHCHDVTNPVRNRRDPDTGSDLGRPMPIERTYTEWAQSLYADESAPEHADCQECHMPEPDLDGDGVIDPAFACMEAPQPRGEGLPYPGPVRTHVFAGANAWMLELLREEVGVPLGREESFDVAIAATRELLSRTVEVSVDAPGPVDAGSDLLATVRVTNLAGHKFPTGYPEGRRAWLRVRAGEDSDEDGVLDAAEVGFVSGAHDASTGSLVEDPQVKVWELEIGVWNWNGTGTCDTVDASGRKIFHFVLNDCIARDPRIPPLGFVPDEDTAPVGHSYPENPALPGTLAHWDDATYAIPVLEEATRPILVEAEVLHQATSPEYVEFLRDENESTCDPFDPGCDPSVADARPNRGEKMHALWVAHDRAPPEVLETASASVAVVPAPRGACCVGEGCFELTEGACADQAGEWRGDGTTCPAESCEPPPSPPPGEARDLRVTGFDPATGELSISYTPACDALDHAAVHGPLSTLAPSGIACTLGVTGTAAVPVDDGSAFVLVVGKSTTREGSRGRDSFGAERPEGAMLAPCDFPLELGACE